MKTSTKIFIIVLLFGGFSMVAQDTDPENPPVCNPLDFTSAISPDGKKVSVCHNGNIIQVSVNALNSFVAKGATNPACGCGDNAQLILKSEESEPEIKSDTKEITGAGG